MRCKVSVTLLKVMFSLIMYLVYLLTVLRFIFFSKIFMGQEFLVDLLEAPS